MQRESRRRRVALQSLATSCPPSPAAKSASARTKVFPPGATHVEHALAGPHVKSKRREDRRPVHQVEPEQLLLAHDGLRWCELLVAGDLKRGRRPEILHRPRGRRELRTRALLARELVQARDVRHGLHECVAQRVPARAEYGAEVRVEAQGRAPRELELITEGGHRVIFWESREGHAGGARARRP